MIPLSQSHLTHLDICARKYQYVFFDALLGPSTYEQNVTTQWGSQFHLLMQQQALDLPVGLLSQADTDMARSLIALEEAAPEVFAYLSQSQVAQSQTLATENHQLPQSDSDIFSQSEHRRTLEFNGYLLTVIYDLLVISSSTTLTQPSNGQIFDWKTHQKPLKRDRLQTDWQTRLYSYVLCETSGLMPEQISMTYWFVRTEEDADASQPSLTQSDPQKPSFYRFGYTLEQHDKTRKDLQRLTDSLTQMREKANFPKVAIEKGYCDYCSFNGRCERLIEGPRERSTFGQIRFETTNTTPTQFLKAARQITAETVEEIPL